MKNKDIKELLKLDKELLDYASCMQMATKYKNYNFAYHSLIRQRAEKEIKDMEEKENGI
ncbi:MAG: hypothetical protein KH333_12090 [Clostridium sp.]|nr:hypothetical protein [Clostridium sp.]